MDPRTSNARSSRVPFVFVCLWFCTTATIRDPVELTPRDGLAREGDEHFPGPKGKAKRSQLSAGLGRSWLLCQFWCWFGLVWFDRVYHSIAEGLLRTSRLVLGSSSARFLSSTQNFEVLWRRSAFIQIVVPATCEDKRSSWLKAELPHQCRRLRRAAPG
jgi:hypothetical protein